MSRAKKIAVLGAGGGLGRNVFAIVRLPELYGPSVVTLTAYPFRSALASKRALWPGKLDAEVELVYMPEAGRALVAVATAWTDPILIDGSKYEARFGALPRTPLADAISTTMVWHRAHPDLQLQ